MTLTQRTVPAAIHSAFNPVIYEVSTNRTTAATKSIASIAESGGKLKITTTAAHTMVDADVITTTGITGVATTTRSKVLILSTTELVCVDINWSASYTVSSGTIIKANTNVIVRAQVYVGTSLIATHYTRSETNNGTYDVYKFDLSGVLGDYLDNNAGTGTDKADGALGVATSPATSYSSMLYTVVFTELLDDAAGLQQIGGATTTSEVRAVALALQTGETMAGYTCTNAAAGLMLTPLTSWQLRSGEPVTVAAITTETSVGVKYIAYTSAGAAAAVYGTLATVANNRVQCTIDPSGWGEGQTQWDISFYTGTVGSYDVISNVVSFYKRGGCVRSVNRIQYRNLVSGVDSIYCADRENQSDNDAEALTTTAGGVVVWSVQNDRTVSVTIQGTPTQLAGYEQLLTSRFIWFNGVRCNLLNRSQTTQSREFMTWELKFRVASLKVN